MSDCVPLVINESPKRSKVLIFFLILIFLIIFFLSFKHFNKSTVHVSSPNIPNKITTLNNNSINLTEQNSLIGFWFIENSYVCDGISSCTTSPTPRTGVYIEFTEEGFYCSHQKLISNDCMNPWEQNIYVIQGDVFINHVIGSSSSHQNKFKFVNGNLEITWQNWDSVKNAWVPNIKEILKQVFI